MSMLLYITKNFLVHIVCFSVPK